MTLNWKRSSSTQFPKRVDETMSKKSVYVRVNPKRDGSTWMFDEAIVDREMYEQNYNSIMECIVKRENSADAMFELFVQTVQFEERPTAEKEGFVLIRHYVPEENRVIWTYEQDPNYVPPSGDYLNPIPFISGMSVVKGLFYTLDGEIWEAKNSGIAESFTGEYFDIIGI